MIKYENLVEENIRLKRENNKLDESLSVMSSKYNTVNEKFKSEESYIDFFRNKELIYSNVVSSFPDLQIHKLTEQISGLAFTHDNLQKLNFNAQQQLQISEVKINQFRNTNLQLQDKLDCALDLQKANESEIQGLKLQTQILCQEKAKLQQEIDRKLKEICDLRDEIEEMNLMFEDSERDKALKNEEMAHLVNDKQEKLENLEKAYENAVTKLTEKIAHLQASEKKLNQEVSKLTEELEINSHQSEAEKNQMLSAIKLISDDADKQNEKLKETELQLSKSGALLDQANHDNENLASLLKDRQAEVDCLNTHVSELISKVCTLQTSEFNLNQDLAKTKREFEAESADSNSKNQSIIQNLTEKVEALAMEKENLDLCLRNQVQENIQKLQHKQNQIDQLNLTTESCKVSLNELKSVVSCLEEEKTKLKQVNFSQNSRIDELMYVESELARVKSEKSLITQKFIDLNSDLIREQQDKTELHHKFQQICKEKNDIEIQNFELKDQLAASLKESRELVHFRDVYNEFLHEKNTLTAEICELKGMNSQYIDKIESLQRDLHIAKDEKIHLSQEIVSLASAHNPNDPDIVEKILKAYLIAGGHPNNFVKITDGVYCYGNKKVGICIKNGGIVVRVGGGYMYIEEFLKVYVPPEHGNENVSPNKMMTARFNKVSEHIEELDSSIQEINTDIANGILPKKSPSKSPMKSPFRTPVKK